MRVAVIPARGGSKRIPGKNIKEFAGKPIIAWSISLAIKSGLFDRVIVSTDSDEIASVARDFGAETPFKRSKTLSDDFSTTNEVVKDCLEFLSQEGCDVTHACCLYATAPLLQERYLHAGLELVLTTNADFVFSATTFDFPPMRALRVNSAGIVEARFPECIDQRSQDLEELFHDAGQFYWGTTTSFVNGVSMYRQTARAIMIPRMFVQDIDTLEDWNHAEAMFDALATYRESPRSR